MDAFLAWLEALPLSVAIAESQSIWGFSFILVLHTVGIALTAGTTTMMSFRLLGIASPVPLSSFRILFTLFWAGFYLNALSGTLLFMMAATTTGAKPIYYAKLVFLALALLALRPIAAVFRDDRIVAEDDVPAKVRTMAILSLLCWAGVITTGRLVAYLA